MKKDLHPEYKLIEVKLADGTTFQTRSTMKVGKYVSDVDSTNHPFYTGKRQYVDTAGRVEKFLRRYGKRNADGVRVKGEGEGEGEGAEAEAE